jgi:hypothetical protein
VTKESQTEIESNNFEDNNTTIEDEDKFTENKEEVISEITSEVKNDDIF